MKSAKHNLGTSKSRSEGRGARDKGRAKDFHSLAPRPLPLAPLLEQLESRRMMTTLNVSNGSNVTLDVTPGGGIETIIDGNKTDYSAGQYGNVLVDISGSLTIKATVVPVSIDYANYPITFHGTHGMRDIKASVAINPGLSDNPYNDSFNVTFNETGDT